MGVIKNPDGWKTVEEVNPFGWLENTNHENYREITRRYNHSYPNDG